jgi:hypothetical protein
VQTEKMLIILEFLKRESTGPNSRLLQPAGDRQRTLLSWRTKAYRTFVVDRSVSTSVLLTIQADMTWPREIWMTIGELQSDPEMGYTAHPKDSLFWNRAKIAFSRLIIGKNLRPRPLWESLRIPDTKWSSSSLYVVVVAGPCTNQTEASISRGSHGSGPFLKRTKSPSPFLSISLSSMVIRAATPRFFACTHTLILCVRINGFLRHFTTFYCPLTSDRCHTMYVLHSRTWRKVIRKPTNIMTCFGNCGQTFITNLMKLWQIMNLWPNTTLWIFYEIC